MMLFLRALVILGAVVAVISCDFAKWFDQRIGRPCRQPAARGAPVPAGQCL